MKNCDNNLKPLSHEEMVNINGGCLGALLLGVFVGLLIVDYLSDGELIKK